jgi:hypothetical protein
VRRKNEELKALSNKLAKYLSRQVYNSIFQGTKDVKIESYSKKLTVFFSDIEGFTELSDRLESEVLTSMLNKYLSEMTAIAVEYGGTIDKNIGDAIMNFGDPDTLGDKQDALACVNMALKMRERPSGTTTRMGQSGYVQTPAGAHGHQHRFLHRGEFRLGGALGRHHCRQPESRQPIRVRGRARKILISHSTHSLVSVRNRFCRDEIKVKGLPIRCKPAGSEGRCRI